MRKFKICVNIKVIFLLTTRNSSTSITRIKKSVYPRVYKVRLQQPDGSTFTIRYHEPHELIRLPVDPNSLTEEEKRERLMRSKPEKEIKVQEFDDEETEITQRSWKDFVPSKWNTVLYVMYMLNLRWRLNAVTVNFFSSVNGFYNKLFNYRWSTNQNVSLL